MFCHKCGNQLSDDAAFCPKCGTKLNTNANEQSVSVQPKQQTDNTAPVTPKKKKSKKLPLIIAAVIAVVVIAVLALSNGGGDIDYKATVRAYKPYAESQGLNYTCGEVLDKYISNAEWNVNESEDSAYVDISGIASGTDKEMDVTVHVKTAGDHANFDSISVKLNGEELSDNAFFALFVAYDGNDSDLSQIDELISEVDLALRGGELTGVFTDDVTGISFRYPEWWAILESASDLEIVDMISSRNNAYHRATLKVFETADVFGVFSGDETYVKESVNGLHTFLDYGDAMLGDVPAKALRYQTSGLNGDDIIVSFYYTIGGDVYCISCSYSVSAAAIYEPIFEAIVESYDCGDVTAASMLCYNDISVFELLGESVYTVMEQWGTPESFTEGWGVNMCEYYGICFSFDYMGVIYNIEIAPEMCSFNGISLDKSISDLKGILGTPTTDEWISTEVYRMWYDKFYDEYSLVIELLYPNETPDVIMIY